MKKLSVFLLGILLITACGGGFDAEDEKNKILDIHDEVMPKIGEVMNLKKKVLEKANSLEGAPSEDVAELRDIAQELDEAYNGMMSWMRDWSKNSNQYLEMDNGAEEQKTYLAKEMERVEEVKTDINSSIAKAKEALK